MATARHAIPVQVRAARRKEWRRLVDEQHGVLDVGQLSRFGITRSAISANVRAGRWQVAAPRVYSTFTGPLPWESRVTAALRYAGPHAVVSHRTAAAAWGMCGPDDGPVHVTVPYQCSAVSQPPLVVVHRSRAFRYIAVDGAPPRTSRADTVIDLAAAEPTAREAMRTLTALVTARRAAVSAVREQLRDRPPARYRRALAEAAARIDDGVRSVLEELYAVEVEAAHGIPAARRQQPFLVDGRVLIEDAVYDDVGVPLTVRLDGQYHLRRDIARRDRRRGNAATLAGRTSLTYGWDELADPCTAAGEVAAVLRAAGWAGPLHPCPRARECGVTL
jgi:hypothetical protein